MNLMRFLGVSSAVAILWSLWSPHAFAGKADHGIDALLIKAQQICPVSGTKLGEHGDPVKVDVDGQTLFLCCDGCKNKPLEKEHLAKISAHQIEAQKMCPVMNRELPENAAYTVVKGRTVYVCCKPCIKKIQADPQKYVQKYDALLVANIGSEK